MRYETLEPLRRTLLRKRSALLRRRNQTSTEEHELLADREPDWEDAAAIESAATVMESLTERERLALARIQSSLERMQQGTYGECAVCHQWIDERRLRLLPDTDRCAPCAERLGPRP